MVEIPTFPFTRSQDLFSCRFLLALGAHMAMLMGYPQFCTQDTDVAPGRTRDHMGYLGSNLRQFCTMQAPSCCSIACSGPKALVFGFFFRFWNLYDSFLEVAIGFPYSSLLLHFCDFLSHLCL